METGDPVIIDGTGRKLNKMYRQIEMAKEHGYTTTVLYVYTPLTISQLRNADRDRQVPPDIVTSMYEDIKNNYPKVRDKADRGQFVDNVSDKNEDGISFDSGIWERSKDRVNAFFLEWTGRTFPEYMLEEKPEERPILRDLGIIGRRTTPQDLLRERKRR